MDSSLKQRVSSKRRLCPCNALQLVLEPPSVPAKKRGPEKHLCLQADDHNRVLGSVNGHECLVQLDSGAQVTIMFHSLAKRLGLIRGTEPTTKESFCLMVGQRVLDVINLKEVTISLGQGVEVLTPVTVFPASLENMYNTDTIVLDAHHLRRGHMVQEFRPGGSDVFIRRPQQLRRRVRRSQRAVEQDVLWVRLKHGAARAKPMSVVVDTGAQSSFQVSDRRLKRLQKSGMHRSLPRRVEIDLGAGCHLKAAPLKTVAFGGNDFIMGVSLLSKYSAVMNHARHTLAFMVGSQRRQVVTQTGLSSTETETCH